VKDNNTTRECCCWLALWVASGYGLCFGCMVGIN